MKRLLLSLALLGLAGSAEAQVSVDVSNGQITGDLPKMEVSSALPLITDAAKPASFRVSAAVPLSSEKISYYDESLTTINWVSPLNLGNAVGYMYAQRFTLSTDGGAIDSIRLNFVQTQGNDPIFVALIADTLATFDGGLTFHVVNVAAQPFAAVQFPASAIPANSWVTINLDKAIVPKNFFVVVLPSRQELNFTSAFALRGDSKPVRELTTDNARSGVVLLTSATSVLALPLDNLITLEGQSSAAFTDFYIEAYPSSETGSVGRDVANTPASVYPNPVIAGNMLRINHAETISQVRLVNALGVEVSNWNGMSQNVELPIAKIAGGVYHLLITTDSGVTSEKVVVQ